MSKYLEKCEVHVVPRIYGFESGFRRGLPPAIDWSISGSIEIGDNIPVEEIRQVVEDLIFALSQAKGKKIVKRMQELQGEFQGKEFLPLREKDHRRD